MWIQVYLDLDTSVQLARQWNQFVPSSIIDPTHAHLLAMWHQVLAINVQIYFDLLHFGEPVEAN
jgi:hypothetical protein